jgi:hypothetical protein
MDEKLKNYCFKLKDELEKVKLELKTREKAYRNLENKYRTLLLIASKKGSTKPCLNKISLKKTKINQKRQLKVFSLRALVAVGILLFVVSYSIQFSLAQNSQYYAYITKGLVFPKRCIASVGSLFYDNK